MEGMMMSADMPLPESEDVHVIDYSFDDGEPHRKKPGRPNGNIWDYFEKIKVPDKHHPSAKCNVCGAHINTAKPKDTLLPHILRHCPQATQITKHIVRNLFMQTAPPVVQPDVTIHTAVPRVEHRNTVSQDEFEMVIARAFTSCALPFALIESAGMQQMFATLVPHLRLPSRQKLGNELMIRVEEEVRQPVIKKISHQGVVSLVTDGWSDPNSASIVNYMVAAPGMTSLFWSSKATGANEKTAKFLATEIKRVIMEIEHQSDAVVAGVVTDNAPNMIKAQEILELQLPVFTS
jgi:Protein of unknown function (DUF 659)